MYKNEAVDQFGLEASAVKSPAACRLISVPGCCTPENDGTKAQFTQEPTCCEWKCPHWTQATLKDLRTKIACPRPVWIWQWTDPELEFSVHSLHSSRILAWTGQDLSPFSPASALTVHQHPRRPLQGILWLHWSVKNFSLDMTFYLFPQQEQNIQQIQKGVTKHSFSALECQDFFF